MFRLNKRGNIVWLSLMGTASVIMMAAGGGGAIVGLGLLGSLFVGIYRANREPRHARLQSVHPLELKKGQTSTNARNASYNVMHHPDYDGYNYILRDIGLIIDETNRHGIKLRQVRFVSLDDDSIRPYVVLNTRQNFHAQSVIVRFEIRDSAGERQFICEMNYWMRAGDNILLPDYRLPLRNNERIVNHGKWDLQIWINNSIVGIHNFDVSPSIEARRRQFHADGEAQQSIRLESDPVPLSLDELLTDQQALSRRSR